MQYKINNIVIKDLTENNKYEKILSNNFLKQTDKQKLEFITDNINIYFNDSISLKHNKIKFFLLNTDLSLRKIDKVYLEKFINKLLAKLIYDYKYLLK